MNTTKETSARICLMSALNMTPDEIACAEWRSVGEVLQQAQDQFAKVGQGRQSWMDWAIALCCERGKGPWA